MSVPGDDRGLAAAFVRLGVDDDRHKSSFLGVVGMIGPEERREGEQTIFIKEFHSKAAETRNGGCRGSRAKTDGVYLCSWGPVGQRRNSAFPGGSRCTGTPCITSCLCIFSKICARLHTRTPLSHTSLHIHNVPWRSCSIRIENVTSVLMFV